MRQPVHSSRGFRFGVYELSAESQELRKYGLRIRLSGQAFQILVVMLERPGAVLSREELRQLLWPGEPWGDHDQRLNKAINKIRDALNDSAETPRYIETIPRVGYRFVFPVEVISSEAPRVYKPLSAEPSVAAPSIPEPTPPPRPAEAVPATVSIAWPKRPRWLVLMPAAALALAILIGFVLYRASARSGSIPEKTMIPVPLSTFVGAEQQPGFAPDGIQVVFSWAGEQQDNFDLYVGRVGEGGARRLTRDPRRDSNPVWSPDGKWIAFRRNSSAGRSEIALIQPDGQGEHRVGESSGIEVQQDSLAWTPDSKHILFADMTGGSEAALFTVSTATGERKRLTSPPARLLGDLSPSISPDGTKVVFTRDTSFHGRDLFLADLSPDMRLAGDLIQITNLKLRVDTAVWTPDGKEVIFAAAVPAGGINYLYRMNWRTREVRDIGNLRLQGSFPALSRDGRTLAFSQRTIEQTSIWRIDLPNRGKSDAKRTRLISSTSRDYSPDISPDGKRVVMSSIRSGGPQLWIFNVDGSDPRQLTFLGANGASIPRWSPDGKSIVFDSHPEAATRLFTLEVETGKVRQVETGTTAATRGNWSRDGKFLYFNTTARGDWQIYRVPVDGGKAVKVTKGGGSFAVEDFAGGAIFFTSINDAGGFIRRTDLKTGEEIDLVKNVLGASALALGPGHLYYLTPPTGTSGIALWSYDLRTRQNLQVLTFDKPVHRALTISPDGQFLVVTQVDRQDTDLMIVPQFR